MDGCVDGFDATFVALGGAGCLLDGAATLDGDLAFGGVDAEDFAFFAFVIASDDADFIALFDMCLDAAHGENLLDKIRGLRVRGRRFS